MLLFFYIFGVDLEKPIYYEFRKKKPIKRSTTKFI